MAGGLFGPVAHNSPVGSGLDASLQTDPGREGFRPADATESAAKCGKGAGREPLVRGGFAGCPSRAANLNPPPVKIPIAVQNGFSCFLTAGVISSSLAVPALSPESPARQRKSRGCCFLELPVGFGWGRFSGSCLMTVSSGKRSACSLSLSLSRAVTHTIVLEMGSMSQGVEHKPRT